MQDLKNKIYEAILERKDKKVVVFWSGGAFSALVWFIAYQDLHLRLPVVFIDDGSFPPSLYAFLIATSRKFKLDYKMVQCEAGKLEETKMNLAKEYDIVLTGRKTDYGFCPLPEGNEQELWNNIKVMRVPYFRARK